MTLLMGWKNTMADYAEESCYCSKSLGRLGSQENLSS